MQNSHLQIKGKWNTRIFMFRFLFCAINCDLGIGILSKNIKNRICWICWEIHYKLFFSLFFFTLNFTRTTFLIRIRKCSLHHKRAVYNNLILSATFQSCLLGAIWLLISCLIARMIWNFTDGICMYLVYWMIQLPKEMGCPYPHCPPALTPVS